MAERELVVVYTDGACIGNPGPGGWAWATSPQRYAFGADPQTTNQRMELTAAIEAVAAHEGPLEVVSDSEYVVRCFQDKWWVGWRKRGWRNSRGDPVANQDLWKILVTEVVDQRGGDITFRWVKGHSGEPLNELVDRLANEAARSGTASAAPAF
ncbi:MAG TPA: ribonuclease H [Acidimicrobiales bacterium]|nr:ribonuclease H [Acidimicrobiales bacterium]